MKPDFVANVMLSVLFGMLAIPFVTVGIRGLKTRRPFLTSVTLPFLIMLILCISLVSLPLMFSFAENIPIWYWSLPILCACSILVSYYVMKGFIAFGVTFTLIYRSLLETLENLEIPYEETRPMRTLRFVPLGRARAIKLKSGGGYLFVSTLIGAVHLKVTKSQHQPELKEIVDAMNEQFHTYPSRTDLTSFAFYTVVALLLFALSVVFLTGFY